MSDTSAAHDTYEEVPYPCHPFRQTHPDRLATIGILFGLEPPPIDRCRVLEIGCARGENLVPMAEQLPGSQFLGLDRSPAQIKAANDFAARAGLTNVEFREGNILDFGADLGTFDYIVSHGVFSWVPPAVQDKMLDLCATYLSPNGIAYISYNTFPGWHMRAMIRDMMCYHTSRFQEPEKCIQQARGLLDFLARSTPKDNAYGKLLRGELESLRSHSDGYLFHEHLEEFNIPLYFFQFIERAERRGLQYLGEADMSSMWTGNLPADVAGTIQRVASDSTQLEQYMDFVRNRTFRQTLLCRQGLTVDRELHPADLDKLYVASPLVPADNKISIRSAESTKFKHPGSSATFTTSTPLAKAAFLHLAEQWPAPVAYPKLVPIAWPKVHNEPFCSPETIRNASTGLGKCFLECYLSGLVEFYSQPPAFSARVGDRPATSRVARAQVQHRCEHVTNLRHESRPLSEPNRWLVGLLDGTRDRQALIRVLRELVREGVIVLSEQGDSTLTDNELEVYLARSLDKALTYLAANAFLSRRD